MIHMPLIRPFKATDIESVVHISNISLNEDYDTNIYFSISESWNGIFLVAIENGVIVGFINGLVEDADTSRILMLAVHPEYRKKSIGNSLLDSFISVSISVGVDKVMLEVRPSNLSARRFYINRKFRPVERVDDFYVNGESCIRMVRSLGGEGR